MKKLFILCMLTLTWGCTHDKGASGCCTNCRTSDSSIKQEYASCSNNSDLKQSEQATLALAKRLKKECKDGIGIYRGSFDYVDSSDNYQFYSVTCPDKKSYLLKNGQGKTKAVECENPPFANNKINLMTSPLKNCVDRLE